MKYWMSLLLVCASTLCLRAQLVEFPTDPARFEKEMVSFLKQTKQERSEAAAEQFSENVKGGNFSGDIMDHIIATSNIMIARKMRASTHFTQYVNTVNNFVSNGMPKSQFATWAGLLDRVIQDSRRGNNKNFTNFIKFSDALFTKNALYESKSKSWLASNKDYVMKYDSVPKLLFNKVDLIGYSASDTVNISETSGTYYPLTQTWKGLSGVVNWGSVGLSEEEVFAELDKYELDVTDISYRFDTVTFHHKTFFDYTLEGTYINKFTPNAEDASYPRFVSYRNDVDLKNIGEGIIYRGGFALYGTELVGAGTDTSKAQLVFYRGSGQKVINVLANEVFIKLKEGQLTVDKAQVSLYPNAKDSIFHPSLKLKYRIEDKYLELYTGSQGVSASAFTNSYHRHQIKTDAVLWHIEDSIIYFNMLDQSGKDPMVATSEEFFQEGEFRSLQAIEDFNPLSKIKLYADKMEDREFYADELAKFMSPRYTENTIKRTLYKLAEQGFIYYFEDRGVVVALPKTFNYIKAFAGKKDYDVIRAFSISSDVNGKLDLNNSDLELNGVTSITLSDTQNVRIFPPKRTVKLKKNRDMFFSGIVMAGNVDFDGYGFFFDYDSFMVDLTDLASAIINVPTGEYDDDGDAEFVPLHSRIEGLTGFLEIDLPNNKAGLKKNPSYPVYTNRKTSYVYYDKNWKDTREYTLIHDSTYIRDRFYFEIDPFRLDSLNIFDPYNQDFIGRLVSADIFPTFDQQLRIMPDLSLGFDRSTPSEGFPIYKGKGHYNDSIFLSNTGLRGKGEVEYLFTDFTSQKILFTPDSLNAITDTFNMEKTEHKGFTYPYVLGADNDLHWLPYKDTMYIRMQSTPFTMFEKGSTLKGDLLLTLEGLKGDGRFEFKEAALTSELFSFESDAMSADTLSLEIKSIAEDRATFNTPNVNGRVDFETRIGEFKSNEEGIPTTFANNLYKTDIDEFTWDMDNNILEFRSPVGNPATFTSIKEDQDSLRFYGTKGVFDMTSSIIDVTGVEDLRVADASIIPDSNKVVIMPGGLLDTLVNAEVYVDTTEKSHRLYEATLIVESKREFHGSGLYDYVYDDVSQAIKFEGIDVRLEEERKAKNYKTFANTEIQETDNFSLNQKIDYYGSVSLEPSKTNLFFSGFGKLNLDNEDLDSVYYFNFEDEIDPNATVIHYDELLSEGKDTLEVGINYTPYDSLSNYYPSITTPLRSSNDERSFIAKGIMKYNPDDETFTFGDEDRIMNNDMYGNVLTYNPNERIITADGAYNMGVDFSPIEMITSGVIDHQIDSNRFVFNSFAAFNLPIDKEVLEQLATDIKGFTFDKPAVDYTTEKFEHSLANVLDKKKGAKHIAEMKKTPGTFVRPKDLDYNVVLSDVPLLYDAEYQIFRSIGPIEISFVGEQGIHKKVEGYVEFGIRKANDFFNIYIESSFDDYVYLTYGNKTLQMYSTNEDFNKLLAAIPNEKRQVKTKDHDLFFYTISSHSAAQSFLMRMNNIVKGIKVEMNFEPEDNALEREMEELRLELLEEEELDGGGEFFDPRKGKKGKGASDEEDDMFEDREFDPRAGDAETPVEESETPTEHPMLKEIEEFEEGGKKKGKKGADEKEEVIIEEIPEEELSTPTEETETPVEDSGKKKGKKGAAEEEDDDMFEDRDFDPSSDETETPAEEENPMLKEIEKFEEGGKKKKKKGE